MFPSRRWFALALLPLMFFLLPSEPDVEEETEEVPGGVEVTPDAGGPI